IFLKDSNDHPKNQKRIEATYSLLNESMYKRILQSEEKDFLFRMFDLLYLLDWVSFYSAILYGIDPTPITIIKKLKSLIQS
ncbi:MAG: SIS domain-containing protein, partial [Candidatus Kapaibacteriota bacterium]